MDLIKNDNLSYWELKHYFKIYDLVIVGAGIVGLNAAISFKLANKKATVLVIEGGIFPDGASTKNAGFACFGTPGELLDDLTKMSEKTVWETVQMRWRGLQFLRARVKDRNMDYKELGGFELFKDRSELLTSTEKLPYLNKQIAQCIGLKNCYSPQSSSAFGSVSGLIANPYEGQIDTGLMMKSLNQLCQKHSIELIHNIRIRSLTEVNEMVELASDSFSFKGRKVIVATNGFAQELLDIEDVLPARAQVLITKPIKNLKIKGCFHLDKGYYYFRNVDNRLLLGGGRNLDFKGEQTTTQALNKAIQDHLDQLLKAVILPEHNYEIDARWSGIMGVGKEKKPIIKKVGRNILTAVRMGGMGVAIGGLVGDMAAKEMTT
jgi:gamma-glutamylputrescine oxidase